MTKQHNHHLGQNSDTTRTILKKGDASLENGVPVLTKSGNAELRVAEGTEVLPNVWDKGGGNYTPNKGDIIMYYGDVPKNWGIMNPNVLDEMNAKGLEIYPDYAVSNTSTIYRTYLGNDERNFNKKPLKAGERVPSHKIQFPVKVIFPDTMTAVETLEVLNGTGKPHIIAPFQFVVTDVDGYPYAKDIKDLKKRYEPEKGNSASEKLFEIINEILTKRDAIKTQNLTEKEKESVLEDIWEKALPKLRKLAK